MKTRARWGGAAMVALALGCQAPGVPSSTPSPSEGTTASASPAATVSKPFFPVSLKAQGDLAPYAGHQLRVRNLITGALVPVAALAGATQGGNSVAMSALVDGKVYLENPPLGALVFEFTKAKASGAAARTLTQFVPSLINDDFMLLMSFGILGQTELSSLSNLNTILNLNDYLNATNNPLSNIILNSPSNNLLISPESAFNATIAALVFQNSIFNPSNVICSFPTGEGSQGLLNLGLGLQDVMDECKEQNAIVPSIRSEVQVGLALGLYGKIKEKKAKFNNLINSESNSIRNRALSQIPTLDGPCANSSPSEGLKLFETMIMEAQLSQILTPTFPYQLNLNYFGTVPSAGWPTLPKPSVLPGASPGLANPSPSPTLVPQPSPSMNETGTEGTDRPDPPLEEA